MCYIVRRIASRHQIWHVAISVVFSQGFRDNQWSLSGFQVVPSSNDRELDPKWTPKDISLFVGLSTKLENIE